MSLRNTTPLSHSAYGCADTLDGTNTPPGAQQSLQNLVPDPTTRNLFYCRPGMTELIDFAAGGFSNPGFISCFLPVGTLIYGLIATDATPGYDEPWCYDTDADAFIAVSGVTGLNVPSSPATTGAWTPPTMALVGTYVVVTHPGFPGGAGNYFGWFDISTPGSPAWDAGNTATNALAAVPKSVANFNNRAYYAVLNGVTFSDSLDPLTVAASSDTLTLGDNTDVTALAPLPLNTALLGGVIQSLIAFKGATAMFQITGDKATSDLAANALPLATGTEAPATLTTTPKGLMFVSPQGLRLLDFQAHVSDPIGNSGFGMTLPFSYSVVPSRMAAAFNADTVRITTQNGYALGTPTEEWWYNIVRQCWTGPHTCAASLVKPFGNIFAVAPVDVTGKLYASSPVQTLASVYTEFGAQLAWKWQTSVLPDTGSMNQNAMIETLLRLAVVAGQGNINVAALNENGSVIDLVTLSPDTASVWGQFNWGEAVWGGTQANLAPVQIPWTAPIVFRCLSVYANGNSIGGFRIGNLWMRYEDLGYLLTAGVSTFGAVA